MRGATTRIGPRLLLAATPTPIPNITVKIGCANGVTRHLAMKTPVSICSPPST